MRSLASQGAQLILLDREPSSLAVQQLLLLIQQTTSNERVYAESCDTSGSASSIQSIATFCEKWKKNRKRSPTGEDLGFESIDSLILSDDLSTTEDGFGSPDQGEKYHGACLRAKLAIVGGLMPVLQDSKTRVINVVSPFYAASSPISLPPAISEEPWVLSSPWRAGQPWTFAASPALSSIAVLSYLAKPPHDLTALFISPGVSRAWLVQVLTAQSNIAGWLLVIILGPFIWALGKSTPECTTAIERGIHVDLQRDDRARSGIHSGGLIAREKQAL